MANKKRAKQSKKVAAVGCKVRYALRRFPPDGYANVGNTARIKKTRKFRRGLN